MAFHGIPCSKGTKGLSKSNATSFKPGNIPWTAGKAGTGAVKPNRGSFGHGINPGGTPLAPLGARRFVRNHRGGEVYVKVADPHPYQYRRDGKRRLPESGVVATLATAQLRGRERAVTNGLCRASVAAAVRLRRQPRPRHQQHQREAEPRELVPAEASVADPPPRSGREADGRRGGAGAGSGPREDARPGRAVRLRVQPTDRPDRQTRFRAPLQEGARRARVPKGDLTWKTHEPPRPSNQRRGTRERSLTRTRSPSSPCPSRRTASSSRWSSETSPG